MTKKVNPSSQRRIPVEHLSFGSYFFFKNDLTVFQLVEKDFLKRLARAQVLHHPDLKKQIPFSEMVCHLKSSELGVIVLLIRGYNS